MRAIRANHILACLPRAIAIGLWAIAGPALAQAIDVYLPELQAPPGKPVTIEIRVSSTTGRKIYSVDLALAYDPTILTATSVSTSGTLAQAWGPPTYNSESGRLVIAAGGTEPLSGEGVLFRIAAQVAASAAIGAESPLTFLSFQFNEGTPAARLHNGSFRVVPDVDAPRFSRGPEITQTTTHSATLSFSTDEPAKAVVQYGTTPSYGSEIQFDDLRTSRTVTLHPLLPSTAYHYRVLVTDEHGNGPNASADATFRTQDIVIRAGQITGDPGTDVTVEVTIADVSELGIQSVEIGLEFDAAALAATGVSADATLASSWPPPNFSVGPGQADIALSGTVPLAGSGVLLRVTFHVLDTAPVGLNTPIRLARVQLAGGRYPAVTQDGLVRIRDTRPPRLVAGPTVSDVEPHSATVAWRSDEPATSVVELRRSPGGFVERLVDRRLLMDHRVALSQLESSQTYSLRVGGEDSSGNGPAFSEFVEFHTPPFAGPALRVGNVETGAAQAFEVPVSLEDGAPEMGQVREFSIVLGCSDPAVSLRDVELDPSSLPDWQTLEKIVQPSFCAIRAQGPGRSTQGVLARVRGETADIEGIARVPIELRYVMLDGGLVDAEGRNGWVTVQGRPDASPPQFLAGPVAEPTGASAIRVRWIASEGGRYRIDYGPTTGYGASLERPSPAGLVEARLEGLTGGQSYHLRLGLWDDAGNGPVWSDDLTVALTANAVDVWLDSEQRPAGTTFELPVRSADLSGLTVYSFDATVRFDPEVLECVGVTSEGCLTAGWGDAVTTLTPGRVVIAMGGVQALTGSGSLVKLRFRVKSGASSGRVSLLWFERFVYNEGSPAVRARGGHFRVADNQPPSFRFGPSTFDLMPTGALVIWTTDEPSDGYLTFGPSPRMPGEAGSNLLSTLHLVALRDLLPATEYSIQAQSTDSVGNGPARSPAVSFTTPAAGRVSFSLGSAEGDVGDTVTFRLSVDEIRDVEVYAAALTVEYPQSVLQFVELSSSGTLSETWSTPQLEVQASRIRLTFRAQRPLPGPGTLALLRFRVCGGGYGRPSRLTFAEALVNGSSSGTSTRDGSFVLVDHRAPLFTVGPTTEPSSPSEVTIYFETSEPSVARVEYGLTPQFGNVVQDTKLALQHCVTLRDLSPSTLYHYRVGVWDSLNNGPTYSPSLTFVTPSGNEPSAWLPDTTVGLGDTLVLPVRVRGLPPVVVQDFELRLLLPKPLLFLGPVAQNTLVAGWSLTAHVSGDTVLVAGSGRGLSGTEGVLVHLMIAVNEGARPRQRLYVPFLRLSFNLGSLPALTRGAQIELRDVTPPFFLQAPAIALRTSRSVSLRWTTSEPTTGWVHYGKTVDYGLQLKLGMPSVEHLVPIPNLEPATSYHARVAVVDTAGNGPTYSEDLVFTTLSETVRVWIGQVEGAPGFSVDVPVFTSAVDGFGIRKFDLAVVFDPRLLVPSGGSLRGGIAESWGTVSYSVRDSLLSAQAWGQSELQGEGVLVWLRFTISGLAPPGVALPIRWQHFRYENGYPPALAFPGWIRVTEGGAGVAVRLPDTVLAPGTEATLPVRCPSLTGLGVLSLCGVFRARSDVVRLLGLETTGALTERWPTPQVIAGDDSLAFSFSGTEALEDSGALFFLRVRIPDTARPGDSTRLRLEPFVFNQGRPAASVRHGIVHVSRQRDVIAGQVLDGVLGTGVGGASVYLTAGSGFTFSGTTNGSGLFRFSGLDTSSSYDLWAVAPGYSDSDTLRRLVAGTLGLQVQILPKNGRIEGWVQDLESGEPLHGVVVLVQDGHGSYGSANTDAAGFFRIGGLARKFPYQLKATNFGYADVVLQGLRPDTTIQVAMAALRGVIRGCVRTAAGEPVAKVTVVAQSATVAGRADSTISSEDGRFLFPRLRLDTYVIFPVKSGFLSRPAQVRVALSAGDTAEADFVLKEARVAKLKITGPGEIPNWVPTSFSCSAVTDSGETVPAPQIRWKLEPSVAGATAGGIVYPNASFLGPALLVALEPLSGVADSLPLTIYSLLSPSQAAGYQDGTGFRVAFEAGSVDRPIQIRLDRPPTPDLKKFAEMGVQVGHIYRLSPSSYVLRKPAQVVLPVPIGESTTNLLPVQWDERQASWIPLPALSGPDTSVVTTVTELGELALLRPSRELGIGALEFVPNPFSPSVDTDGDGRPGLVIRFVAHSRASRAPLATVTIYNLVGQKIRELVYRRPVPKEVPFELHWDGTTEHGLMARNGRYLVWLRVEDPTGHRDLYGTVVLIK
ncbi:MAG: cohesin domain-containing protein [candidate division KSB1 bacterium]|nr:cohesin domain-containing protein [candidate division KSB1 bacterium]